MIYDEQNWIYRRDGTGYGGSGNRTGTSGNTYAYGNNFRLGNGTLSMGLKVNCLLFWKKKNHITCQVEREILQLNFTLYEDLDICRK